MISYGKKENIVQETGVVDGSKGAASPDHEDGKAHQNLEREARPINGRRFVAKVGRHNHRGAAGCHRCGFKPSQRQKA